MEVLRTLDVGLCLEILTDKDIFDSISEDGATFEHLKVDVIKDFWLAVFNDDDIIGCVQLKPKYTKCYEAHIHILPKHRKHSIDAGHKIAEWIEDNLKGCVMYTEVPSICENVIDYLKLGGFEASGKIKNAYSKNGELHDLIILTRGF